MNKQLFQKSHKKLRFILIVLCLLLALGQGSPRIVQAQVAASETIYASATATHAGFKVSGRYLLDANGNIFTMRGLSAPHNWFPGETNSSLQNIKAKNVNTVRVVLSSGRSRNGLSQRWPVNSAGDVADVVSVCKNNRLICVMEVHDTTGYRQDPGAASLAQTVDYWIAIKNALIGQEAYVIINIGNEPYGSVDASDWINATKDAIAAMRSAGFRHTLMVDAPSWGQDSQFIMRDNAAAVFNSDPMKNTVFSVHMYADFNTAAKVENYVLAFVNEGLPLVIGEFGHQHDFGDPDEDAIMSVAKTYGIGYLGWIWSGDSYLDIVNNFDPDRETWWGNRLIRGTDGIIETSQEASVYPVKLDSETTGVFRPGNGLLYLKNHNTSGFADVTINYGLAGDYPLVGDWDGNGTVTIGVYRNGYFYLKNANTLGFAEVVFPFGRIGDQPIAGDWDGNGVDTIGVYRPSTGQFLLRNENSEGSSDTSFYLGNVGDVGIAGDWDGDGLDTTGVFRPSNGFLFLKNKNEDGFADIALNYGLPGDRPVTGDWDNNGVDTIGVYRQGQFLLRNSNTIGFADISFGLGNPGDIPIAGNWDGLP